MPNGKCKIIQLLNKKQSCVRVCVCVCLASSLGVSAYMRKQFECAHRRKAERERAQIRKLLMCSISSSSTVHIEFGPLTLISPQRSLLLFGSVRPIGWTV